MELVFFDTLMAIKGACSCIKQWWIKSGSDTLGQYNGVYYFSALNAFSRYSPCLITRQGIEMLSLGSFKTGGILLLLFPTRVVARPYSILGLGDIVIPGMAFLVALALMFDVTRGSKSNYFKTHYVIHCTSCYRFIGFLAAHCIWNGEVKPLLEFDESKTTTFGDGDADETTSKKEEFAVIFLAFSCTTVSQDYEKRQIIHVLEAEQILCLQRFANWRISRVAEIEDIWVKFRWFETGRKRLPGRIWPDNHMLYEFARKMVVSRVGAIGCYPTQKKTNSTGECIVETEKWSASYLIEKTKQFFLDEYISQYLYGSDTRTKNSDDGGGMTPEGLRTCMSLGYSKKKILGNSCAVLQIAMYLWQSCNCGWLACAKVAIGKSRGLTSLVMGKTGFWSNQIEILIWSDWAEVRDFIRDGSLQLRARSQKYGKLFRGHGTTEIKGEDVETVCGVIECVNKLVYVCTLRAGYNPQVGDIIVGHGIEVAPKRCILEINFSPTLMCSSMNLLDGIQDLQVKSSPVQAIEPNVVVKSCSSLSLNWDSGLKNGAYNTSVHKHENYEVAND
ncbi:signal peptide peptidase [Artemisia annua]|uniref:Signal peptide peptidase n=1 Tax=Artemisia annua TaxID=35608 RepID=A0A2U1PXN4_ARTAN|nr:signal peptide peptidase [Artemisia annua]